MTSSFSPMAGPPPGSAGHAGEDLLAGYAAGQVDGVIAWSIEAHLMSCAACRLALSAYVDAERLTQNRSVLLVRAAIGDEGRTRRLLRRCGVPDYVVRLLAATPSLRLSWLLSVAGVLAVMTGEAALAWYGWGSPERGGLPSQQILVPFLLVAPLLTLAGVSAAFMPLFDPACRLAAAAPLSGFTLLLIRAVSALAAAMIPVVCAAFLLPGPGWLPAALLLPSLALCAIALAAVTVVGPLAAAIGSAALWALPVLLLAVSHAPLAIVQWHAQSACAAVLLSATALLFLRHDRFEFGWMR